MRCCDIGLQTVLLKIETQYQIFLQEPRHLSVDRKTRKTSDDPKKLTFNMPTMMVIQLIYSQEPKEWSVV